MVRAGSGKTTMQRRKRIRKLTKGFRLSRHNLYRQSLTTLLRARAAALMRMIQSLRNMRFLTRRSRKAKALARSSVVSDWRYKLWRLRRKP